MTPRKSGRGGSRPGTIVGIAIGLGLMVGAIAQAVIPLPDRTLRAIAGVNRASGRTQALQLDVTLRVGDEVPIASGEWISHPSGLARLELRGDGGRIDRYLLNGDELIGTTDGRRIPRPRPFLQPLFLLQAGSDSTLQTALEVFGVRTHSIGLAPCGDDDCFVIGDPRLEAPLPIERPEIETETAELGDLGLDTGASGARFEALASDLEPDEAVDEEVVEGRIARFWVDTRELQVRRIDRGDGVVVIFGPIASFDRIKVPTWIEIHDPTETFPMRFEIDRAVQMNAPPGAFDRSWLIPVVSDAIDDPS